MAYISHTLRHGESKMKKYLFHIAILCTVFTSCQENEDPQKTQAGQLTQDIDAQQQSILYGTPVTDEPHTVSLFTMNNDDEYVVCDSDNIKECQNRNGSRYTCITRGIIPVCVESCTAKGQTKTECLDIDGLDMVTTNECTEVDDQLVYFSSKTIPDKFCINACNAAGTNCDAQGATQYFLCSQADINQCKSKGYNSCYDEIFDTHCSNTCTKEGKIQKHCEHLSGNDATFVDVCTDIDGQLIYANDLTKRYYCKHACNSAGTDCDSEGALLDDPDEIPIVSGTSSCTGTLIHPQWVLTAAHCVAKAQNGTMKPNPNNVKLKIGIGNSQSALMKIKTAGPDYIYYHSDYQYDESLGNAIDHDIALIKLKTPIPSSIAEPVLPLPKWLALSSENLPLTMQSSGFGFDENGKFGSKNKMIRQWTHYCGAFNPYDSANGCLIGTAEIKGCHPNPTYCAAYGEFDLSVLVTIPYGTFFAPVAPGGLCNGDSGGPTYVTIGKKQYVAGITSFVDRPCRTYNVITAVQDYYDWIIAKAPEVASQYKEICGNGLDDDGNGLTDNKDPACAYCGNGIINVGEQCDNKEFSGNKTTCVQWDSSQYSDGTVSCNKDCTINFSACTKASYCGNGILDTGESCDTLSFSGQKKSCTEWDSQYISGNVSCNKDCTINYSACVAGSKCGDGIVSGDEDCDGTHFKNNLVSCSSLFPMLYSSGRVKCNSDCTYDTSGCTAYCGNGSVNASKGEACDHSANGDKFPTSQNTCAKVVGEGSTGTLKCEENCASIDFSGCSKPSLCGNKKLDSDEDCDGTTFLGGKTDCSDWNSSYTKGSVTCNANCTVNYSLCESGPVCNNGKLEEGEKCDGTKFDNDITSCRTLFPDLFSSGSVKCTDTCTYDTSACAAYCGNGSVNANKGEVCDHGKDGDKFPTDANTCEKVVGQGSAGTLICAPDCKSIITSGCTEPAYCGDGIINNTEQCDGSIFPDNMSLCSQWDDRYSDGNIKCTPGCGVDFSECTLATTCGDKKVNGDEPCDGISFRDNKTMCSDWDSQYAAGRVSCTRNCELNYKLCRTELTIPDEICDNQIDDDNNGKTDCEDPACTTDEICKSSAVCGNGITDGDEECDGTSFLFDESRCSEWVTSYKSGTLTCNPNCTVNFDKCSEMPAEICDNQIDDNGNGRTDCDDYECIQFAGCLAPTDTENPEIPATPETPVNPVTPGNPAAPAVPGTPEMPANPNASDAQKSSESDCSTSPMSPSNLPASAILLGLFGFGAIVRRRKQ